MKTKYEHTFAIVAYKESPYLEECISSLKKQTVTSDVFISTSTPSRFLDQISEKANIPLIVNKSNNGGIAQDWSFAYNNCKTRYVTLTHQDDLYLPEYTERCLAAAQKERGRNLLIFTDYRELSGGRNMGLNPNMFVKKVLLSAFLFKESISSSFAKRSILSFGDPIACPSVMFNKERIGYFEFLNIFCCNMDWDAWIRLSKKDGSFVYVKKRLMVHRIHNDAQTSVQIRNRIRRKEDRMIFERLWPNPVAKILSGIYYFSSHPGEIWRRNT